MEIRRLGPDDVDVVLAAAELFDDPPRRDATSRFLTDPNHHLLMAFDGDRATGFVTGVETTHPDKGTEMFLYELGVAEADRRRGTGKALVERLAGLARERGCYGMWVLTDDDNVAGARTYASAGGRDDGRRQVVFEWRLGE